ncbi:uncharacterized protein LOC125498831 [Beta vulgaris subsp. vulgaris]|uniref:uncharacterized protein LOC125498831 n=1 Tax=Beta vulgaris subsp. vulgaris TaxID=3555 RepID=UPI002037605F|nr:uncharacterized protein LOC125498831 [Beta vulgaris subsp. vulgaris]
MRSLNREGRELEKRIDQSDYEEPILETKELFHSEEETQGYSRREYITNGASNYLAGGHLLIKAKTFSFHFRNTEPFDIQNQDAILQIAARCGRVGLDDRTQGRVAIPKLPGPKVLHIPGASPWQGQCNDYIRGEEFDRVVTNREPQKKKEDKHRKKKGHESDRGRDERRQESNVVKRGSDRERENERYDRERRDREKSGREMGERKEKFDAYTQLTTVRSQIYLMNKDSDKWQRPKQMFHKNRDKTKWCNFHGDHRHLTEDCRHLKDNLEDLLRRGYFSQYKAQTRSGDIVEPANQNVQSRIIEIHVISDGPIHGGSMNGAKTSLKEFT